MPLLASAAEVIYDDW